MFVDGLGLEVLIFLFLVAATAGFLDTLAGGGGLITLPALIISGIPPLPALATNKLQGTAGTATATWMMLRSGRITLKEVWPLMGTAFIGSTLGTLAVQSLSTRLLRFVIPSVLLSIALYFLFSPSTSEAKGKKLITLRHYRRLVIPVIGWYDGMFGPGTGSFFAFAGVSLRGQGLIDATIVAKTLNFSTNIASLFVFLFTGHLLWLVGLTMMLGQFLGAWVGALFLVKINPGYLRLLVVLMCSGMLLKYAWSMGWFF